MEPNPMNSVDAPAESHRQASDLPSAGDPSELPLTTDALYRLTHFLPVDLIGDPVPPHIQKLLDDEATRAADGAPEILRDSYVQSAVTLKRNRINAILANAYRAQLKRTAIMSQKESAGSSAKP